VIRDVVISIGAFVLGVGVVVWSTERLLAGMLALATLMRLAPFAIAGIFSGLEAENLSLVWWLPMAACRISLWALSLAACAVTRVPLHVRSRITVATTSTTFGGGSRRSLG